MGERKTLVSHRDALQTACNIDLDKFKDWFKYTMHTRAFSPALQEEKCKSVTQAAELALEEYQSFLDKMRC